MELRESIARVARWPILKWQGWRRFGPASGSLGVHAVLGAAFITLLASAASPMRMGDIGPFVEIELLAEAPPAEGSLATPPDARSTPAPAPDADDAVLIAERTREKLQQDDGPNSEAWQGAKSDEDGGVYYGNAAARSGVPLGLRSLLETDPCAPEDGDARGDCSRNWAAMMARGDKSMTPSYERLAELYPGFRPPGKQGASSGPERDAGPQP
jgi:hypothetical protein